MAYNNIHLRLDNEYDTYTLQELIEANNSDGEQGITEGDIERITALKVGESTHLEASHCGSAKVCRMAHEWKKERAHGSGRSLNATGDSWEQDWNNGAPEIDALGNCFSDADPGM